MRSWLVIPSCGIFCRTTARQRHATRCGGRHLYGKHDHTDLATDADELASAARNRTARAANARVGFRSPRSQRASVPGSTSICRNASLCESPRLIRWRTNCSASVFAGLCQTVAFQSAPASLDLRRGKTVSDIEPYQADSSSCHQLAAPETLACPSETSSAWLPVISHRANRQSSWRDAPRIPSYPEACTCSGYI